MKICCVVGARPNFMKMAPVVRHLTERGLRPLLVHTGQHYDERMSRVFFSELGMPRPDVDLEVGSDTHARQTARVMTTFEDVCVQRRPDLVVVGGDVNSTMATALVAAKLQIPVAHVEAGLRSFDRTMPEEVNRILTDRVSELLFTTEASADENLRSEGVAGEQVHFTGNCMVDSLLAHLSTALERRPWHRLGLQDRGYALLTLHRPSNVDDPAVLGPLLDTIGEVSRRLPVVFPVHPRVDPRIAELEKPLPPSVAMCEPLPYLEFIGLMARARLVLTDSGGIQEETTVLGVPCLTLRRNTERPVTVELGTNRLVGTERERIVGGVEDVIAQRWPTGSIPPLWDGRAGERVAAAIVAWMEGR